MKSLTIFIITFLLTVNFVTAQKIGVQPSTLDFHLSPGTTQSQVIKISNLSDKKIGFEAYLADWLRDSTGAHQYFRPDTLERSCVKWIVLSKNFIEIEPGKTEDFLIKLQAPLDANSFKEMKWAMLFLQSAAEQDSTSRNKKQLSTQVKELLRVGIHIYQTPPSITHAEVKGTGLKEVADEKNAYDFYMQNTGEIMLDCKVHLELTDAATGKEFKLERVEFPVFPDGKRKVRLLIPDSVPKGKYSALAILDPGEDLSLEAIERAIEVK